MANSRLDSWKSIASYLGRGTRTVQRWHVRMGMPVHHFGGAKGCVFAFTDDLDAWLIEMSGETGRHEAESHPAVEAKKMQSRKLAASAKRLWDARSERNLLLTTALYREAVDEDPTNCAALVGLSRSLIGAALFGATECAVAFPGATEALRRAAQLEHGHIDVRCTAAWLKVVFERRWREARTSFDEILKEAPADSYALAGRALLYIAEGDLAEANRCAIQAWRENPLAVPLSFLPCWIAYLRDDPNEALELVSHAKATGEHGPMLATVEALALTRTEPLVPGLEKIMALVKEHPRGRALQCILSYGYGLAGEGDEARAILSAMERLSERRKRDLSYHLALIFLGLGEHHEAIRHLEIAFAEGVLWSLGFHADPALRPLRGELRFESLLRKIGPYWYNVNRSPTATCTADEVGIQVAESWMSVPGPDKGL